MISRLIHKLISRVSKALGKNKISILIYHQVLEKTDSMRPSEPNAEVFRWHMKLIKKYYHPLSIPEALSHLANDTLPANAICVTFDDGYINNLDVACPILKEFGIPASVYIATAFIEGENMWNDRIIDLVAKPELFSINLSALGENSVELGETTTRVLVAQKLINKIKYKPYKERKNLINTLYNDNNVTENSRRMMSVNQIIELANYNIEIGAHTAEHPILNVLNESEQRLQIKQSKERLTEILGSQVKGFAYPNGKIDIDYDTRTRNIVEDLGFDYAVSTNWGVSDKQSDKYQLNRFSPWDKTPVKFHFRLMRNIIGR